MEGINRALTHTDVSPRDQGQFVISVIPSQCLNALRIKVVKNVIIKEVIDTIHTIILTSHKQIDFCWVPSHRGIKGNEEADQAAERARRRDATEHYLLPYTDLYPVVEKFIHSKWQTRWIDADLDRPNKLFSLQPLIKPFDTSGLTRREETVIHRLRIGHTRFTHGYLMGVRMDPIVTPDMCRLLSKWR